MARPITKEEAEYRQALLNADRGALSDTSTRARKVSRGTTSVRRLRSAGDELQKYAIGGLSGTSVGSTPYAGLPRSPVVKPITAKPKVSKPKVKAKAPKATILPTVGKHTVATSKQAQTVAKYGTKAVYESNPKPKKATPRRTNPKAR